MSPRSATRRQNGLTPPYASAQIGGWIALVATFLEFIFFVSPLLPLIVSVPLTIYFTAIVVGVVYYGGKTQAVDPVDLHLAVELRKTPINCEGSTENEYYSIKPLSLQRIYKFCNPTVREVPDEPLKQCWICDTMVAEHSMHCKFCNKCVYHFDHHCVCKYSFAIF